jgi:hypothetical protein
MKAYKVISVSLKEAVIQNGKETITIANKGYVLDQHILFDGNAVKVLPTDSTVIYI